MRASKTFLIVTFVIAVICLFRPAVAEEGSVPVYLQPNCAHTDRPEATAPRGGRYPARCQISDDLDPVPLGDDGDRYAPRRANDINDGFANRRSWTIDSFRVAFPGWRAKGSDRLFPVLPLNSPSKAP
jgi:hypothetical protein